MPGLETNDLLQQAVLMPFIGYDSYGQPAVGAPVQINVRWLTKRREVVDAKGNTVAFDAIAIVGQRIDLGSHLWLGQLADWVGTGSGSSHLDQELMEVKTYYETPDIKGRAIRRQVGLMRLHNKGAD